MRKLIIFALENYYDDPCLEFYPKISKDVTFCKKDLDLFAKMHKAITILQFKLEAKIIKRHPEYLMSSQLLLDKVNFDNGTIKINNCDYKLKNSSFGKIFSDDPFKLTVEEEELIDQLKDAFTHSFLLKKHVRFLFSNGNMYLKHNSNLLYHANIPMDKNGNFLVTDILGKPLSGKKLIDEFEKSFRQGYFMNPENPKKQNYTDLMWYLWCGEFSPLFGKKKMATFERYFIENTSTHKEEYNHYFNIRNNEDMCDKVLLEFNLNPKKSHIINGHVPVKTNSGENPVKANGKLIVIDGAFSKSYQNEKSIAGYTLIYNSYGLLIGSHKPFTSIEDAINNEDDILPSKLVVEQVHSRITVGNTDAGLEIKNQIHNLKLLSYAYTKGLIKENISEQ